MSAKRAAKPPQRPAARRPSKRRGTSWGAALAAVVAALTIGAGATGWYAVTPHRGRGAVVRLTIPANVSAGELATIAWRGGVVDRPWVFRALVLATGAHRSVKAGMLPLRDDLTPRAVLRALAHGGGLARVTIPEGFTRFDVARRLAGAGVCDAEAFLARTEEPAVLARVGVPAAGAAPTLEGYLFPDTYDLPLGATPDEVIDRMTGVFFRRLEALKAQHPDGAARAAALAGGDAAEADRALVTLASVVEKETGAPEDRAHIASVFWNRLTLPEFRPRLLQSDPTVVYGCLAGPRAGVVAAGPPCGDPDAGARMPITASMLDDARNPWNTYRHEALPPTPVCNPGARALEAVLAPTPSSDVYFVARGDGRSVFAATLDEHRRNVQRYLRR